MKKILNRTNNRKIIYIISLLFIIISCNDISKKESSAVDAVKKACNCNCSINIGEYEDGNKYFELEMRNNALMNQYSNKRGIISSKLSTIFYKKLNNKEYDIIKFKNISDKGIVNEFVYKKDELEYVVNLENTISSIHRNIKAKKYKELASNFVKSIEVEEINLKNFFLKDSISNGAIIDIKYQGFGLIDNLEDKTPLIQIYDAILRKDNNTQMSIFLNRSNNKIYSISTNWESPLSTTN